MIEVMRSFGCVGMVLVGLALTPSVAYAVDGGSSVNFHIPRQDAETGLIRFAEQADLTFILPIREVADKTTNGLIGEHSVSEAIELLLAGTGLEAQISDGQLIVSQLKSEEEEMRPKIKQRTGFAALLATVIGVSGNAMAQDGPIDEITVKGIRGSLARSLDIKRNADQIVDAISAEDVGKFPDNNVAEALQRITGVAIQRNGGEGQFITVRGLGPQFNTVLINGRTMATDNAGREFSFDVLSADIIQAAEVYKTATPNTQSGGIGSVVNIRTARPFDYDGTRFTVSASGVYDEFSEGTTPEVTGVASWTNDDKTLGALLSASYAEREAREDTAGISNYRLSNNLRSINGTADSTGLTDADLTSLAGLRSPGSFFLTNDNQERERLTINGSFQAQLGDDALLTVDGMHSEFTVDEDRLFLSYFPDDPVIGARLGPNNDVTGFNLIGRDFVANNPGIAGIEGQPLDSVHNDQDRDVDSYQYGANLAWQLNESLEIVADLSTSRAEADNFSSFVVVGEFVSSAVSLDLPANGADLPTIGNVVLDASAPGARGHFSGIFPNTVEDEITEARFDLNWDLDRGPLSRISTGLFLSDREKSTSRLASENGCAFCGYATVVDSSFVELAPIDNFLNGDGGGIPTRAVRVRNLNAYLQHLTSLSTDPEIAALAGNQFGAYTPILRPTESTTIEEEVTSVFLNTEWQGDFGGGLPWSANVGVRIAHTDTTSSGFDAPVTFVQPPGDQFFEVITGELTAVQVENDYVAFLPSANISFDLRDDIVLRMAYSETITRPTLTSLGVDNTFTVNIGATGQSGGGNPALEAFESINYDASFEWYYADAAFLGLSLFHKEFDQFIETRTEALTREGTDNMGNTVTIPFEDTRSRNGEEGSITGFEFALQHNFESLPGAWRGLGAGVNYTYVTSNIDRGADSPSLGCDYPGLSPNSLNLNGFYELGRVSARIAYNYRDEFLLQCLDGDGEPRAREDYGQLDISVAYGITENIQVFVEGINITDENTRDFSRFRYRLTNYAVTGPRYTFGVRGSFE